jgi:hypothetical protein
MQCAGLLCGCDPFRIQGLVKPSQGLLAGDWIKVHEYKPIDNPSVLGLQENGFLLK